MVDEQLICLPTSGGSEHLMTSDHFFVKVERNLKGRVQGTVEVRQGTDDTGQYGPDGRLQSGKEYLFITRYLDQAGYFILVDYALGYVLIDDPDEREELTAEVEGYLANSYTPTPTESDPDVIATRNVQNTRGGTMYANAPTPFPCESWVAATSTAAAPSLNRDNRALGPIFSPDWEWPTVPATPEA